MNDMLLVRKENLSKKETSSLLPATSERVWSTCTWVNKNLSRPKYIINEIHFLIWNYLISVSKDKNGGWNYLKLFRKRCGVLFVTFVFVLFSGIFYLIRKSLIISENNCILFLAAPNFPGNGLADFETIQIKTVKNVSPSQIYLWKYS